ncbi:MAG: glycoside hydrolase family 15 protein, partial [Gaiellaceae bacterium]
MMPIDERYFSRAVDLSFSAANEYLPIAEHGVIGDLHTIALVGTDGTIDWYCPRRFDAPSVFAAILDKTKGGHYRIAPTLGIGTVKQLYFPDTNVLITRFLTPTGVGEVEDFMPVRRAGAAHRHQLIRRVVCVRGDMRFRIVVDPRFDYGRASHETTLHAEGAVFESPDLTLTLSSKVPLHESAGAVTGEFKLVPGESMTFVLEETTPGEPPSARSEEETRVVFEETVEFWRRWVSQSRYQGRWREMLHRSALTLKLLTYKPTGAIVAAPTTSLPEQLGGGRNWDYRYTWIRDAAFSLYGLLRLGFTEEAASFMDWLTDRFREREGHGQGPLQIMYGIDGNSDLAEFELDHFEGYKCSAPVRVGNGAADQLQLDIYGELIDSVYLYNKYGTPIYHEAWVELSRIVDWVCDNWDQEDEGIWE